MTDNIPVSVFPALATPGRFVLASQRTGNTLCVDDVFGSDAGIKYFESADDAGRHVDRLNLAGNPRKYVLR